MVGGQQQHPVQAARYRRGRKGGVVEPPYHALGELGPGQVI